MIQNIINSIYLWNYRISAPPCCRQLPFKPKYYSNSNISLKGCDVVLMQDFHQRKNYLLDCWNTLLSSHSAFTKLWINFNPGIPSELGNYFNNNFCSLLTGDISHLPERIIMYFSQYCISYLAVPVPSGSVAPTENGRRSSKPNLSWTATLET